MATRSLGRAMNARAIETGGADFLHVAGAGAEGKPIQRLEDLLVG